MNASLVRHPAILIGVGAIGGVVFGVIAGDWAANLKVVGDIFIRLIQMAIVPLVMTSVIVATGSMSGVGAGRLTARTFTWMLSFSAVAALVAVGLSTVLQPGAGVTFTGGVDPSLEASLDETQGWQETVLGFFSTNIIASMSTASMVPIIVFSLLFGVALNAYVAETGNTMVITVLEQMQQVLLTLIRLVMKIAPIGVFALLASLAGQVGLSVVSSALAYLGTTLLGVISLLALLVAVVWVRTRLSPWRLPRKLAEQTTIAVTTTSSAVTYPTVLRTAVERVGISQRVANFTLSIGLTMGSYGAVLNYTVVIFFLAQSGNVDLTTGQVLFGMALAIMLNMGTITVPGGFPVIALFLASTLGLPVEAVGLMIAVDWFTGMFRTFLNVNGDTLVAMLVAAADDEIDRDVYNDLHAAPQVSDEAAIVDVTNDEPTRAAATSG